MSNPNINQKWFIQNVTDNWKKFSADDLDSHVENLPNKQIKSVYNPNEFEDKPIVNEKIQTIKTDKTNKNISFIVFGFLFLITIIILIVSNLFKQDNKINPLYEKLDKLDSNMKIIDNLCNQVSNINEENISLANEVQSWTNLIYNLTIVWCQDEY